MLGYVHSLKKVPILRDLMNMEMNSMARVVLSGFPNSSSIVLYSKAQNYNDTFLSGNTIS